MSNYLVLVYDKNDNKMGQPKQIKKIPYSDKEEAMEFVLSLNPTEQYEVYKEFFLSVEEEEA